VATPNATGGSSPRAIEAEQLLLLHALLKSGRYQGINVTKGKLHNTKILYGKT